MELWFAGSIGSDDPFEIMKHPHAEKDPGGFTLKVSGLVYPIIEDFERQLMDPFKGTQCFRTQHGLYLFPWRWGHDNSTWPRFESNEGKVSLIRLDIERGYKIPYSIAHGKMMEVIRRLLERDARREMPPRRRVQR